MQGEAKGSECLLMIWGAGPIRDAE